MEKKKILFFYNEDWEKDYFQTNLGDRYEIVFRHGQVQDFPTERDEQVEILSVFIGSQIGGAVFERYPNLKYVTTRSTGFDHIDLAVAKQRSIIVSNVPAYGSVTVAEFTFALLLTVTRKVCQAQRQMAGEAIFRQADLRGIDLAGKTLGVIGAGKIGRQVIQRARGFGMAVVAFDRFPDEVFATKNNFRYMELDDCLKQADILTFHIPYNSQTHHLFNRESLQKIKPGMIVINTSRGGVIETMALVEGLQSGQIKAAGLDVLEGENQLRKDRAFLQETGVTEEVSQILINNQWLIKQPNVVVTPHNAFNTQEALERIMATTVENIESFGRGEIMNEVKK